MTSAWAKEVGVTEQSCSSTCSLRSHQLATKGVYRLLDANNYITETVHVRRPFVRVQNLDANHAMHGSTFGDALLEQVKFVPLIAEN